MKRREDSKVQLTPQVILYFERLNRWGSLSLEFQYVILEKYYRL